MNPRMWDHPETREHVLRLAHRGTTIVEPEEGFLACGDEGAGRLASVDRVVEQALLAARRATSLLEARVVVTAGPTFEPIDPVRFIGNRSSGKMGYAIASAARARGAVVQLISGPTALAPPWGVEMTHVETAEEMRLATIEASFGERPANVIIMAAAVADHRPADAATIKTSHKGSDWQLALTPTADVLSELVSHRAPDSLIVGFAAETGDAVRKGRDKLVRKGCDLLVVNDVSIPGAGFESDTNVVTLIAPNAVEESWPMLPKREIAERILDRIEARIRFSKTS